MERKPPTTIIDDEKKVAFLLGTHERVGENSPLLGLGSDKDVLRVVTDFAFSKRSLEEFEGILGHSFGKKGEGEGEFYSPTYLVFDSVGNLVVSDSWDDRLQWFSPKGVFLRSLPLEFRPRGIAFLTEEILIITSWYHHQTHLVSVEDGSTLEIFGKEGNGKDDFSFLEGVAVDSEHEQIFVVDCNNHRVRVLSSSGEFVRSFGKKGSGEGELRFPNGVAIDPEDGNVVVVDTENHRVVVFSQEGRWLRSFGKYGEGEAEFNFPRGVAVDCDGNIAVCDERNHRVQLFNSGGDFLKSFGKEGEGEGEFKFPWGVAIDEKGRIAVSNTDNYRIEIYS